MGVGGCRRWRERETQRKREIHREEKRKVYCRFLHYGKRKGSSRKKERGCRGRGPWWWPCCVWTMADGASGGRAPVVRLSKPKKRKKLSRLLLRWWTVMAGCSCGSLGCVGCGRQEVDGFGGLWWTVGVLAALWRGMAADGAGGCGAP